MTAKPGRRAATAVVVVVVVVVAAALALSRSRQPAARPQAYVGLSAQRLPVKLVVSEDRDTLSLDVSWVGHCETRPAGVMPVAIQRTSAQGVKIADDGRISHRRTLIGRSLGLDVRTRLRIRGRRSARGTIAGTLSVQEAAFHDAQLTDVVRRCSIGEVAFRARVGGNVRQPAPWTDPAGNRVTALDGTPDQVAAGAGAAWIADGAPRERPPSYRTIVTQIDRTTGRRGGRATLDAPGLFAGARPIAAGADAAWLGMTLIEAGSNGPRGATRLARIDARTHRVTTGPRHRRLRPLMHQVAAGASAVWVLINATDRPWHGVLRADPRTGRILRAISLPRGPRRRTTPRCRDHDHGADALAVGAGAVWVKSTSAYVCQPGPIRFRQRLQRIDPRSNRVTHTIALRHTYAQLAVAAGGGVWATTCAKEFQAAICDKPLRPALHRISLRNGQATAITPLPAGKVVGLAASRDGVWLTQTGHDTRGGTLRRLDPTTNRLSTVLRLQGAPSNVSIDSDGAWVIDTFARTLIRVPR